MPEFVRFALPDGGAAVVQVDDTAAVVRAGVRGPDGFFAATTTFDRVIAQISHVADTTIRGLRTSAAKPDEIAVEFGVVLNAQAGAVMVKSNLGAHLQVRLSWKQSAD